MIKIAIFSSVHKDWGSGRSGRRQESTLQLCHSRKQIPGEVEISFVFKKIIFLGVFHGSLSFLRNRSEELFSPTYPGTYPKALDCAYKFIGEPGQRIRLEFRDFDLFYGGAQ